jgi:hypothetical protein
MYKIILMFCVVFGAMVFITEYPTWRRAKRKAKRKAERERNK